MASFTAQQRGLASTCIIDEDFDVCSDWGGSKDVAVIGAGGAGLAAARRLREAGQKVKVFERKATIGGLWDYNEESPMYQSLVTNLPKEVMQFPDYPFPEDLPSFVTHRDMLDYLQSYADHHLLQSMITFGANVDHVSWVRPPCSPDHEGSACDPFVAWEVAYTAPDEEGNQVQKREVFDAVVVCNGHYDDPAYPDVAGMEYFRGELMHSKDYDSPDPFAGKVVLCVGAGNSGTDVARELAAAAVEVHVSDRKCQVSDQGGVQNKVHRHPVISQVREDGHVEFEDGSAVAPDVIIMCTGYHYSFPFLEEGTVSTNDRRVDPLYKHVFHLEHPSLSFIGLPYSVVPFPLFDVQAQWIAAVCSGKAHIPGPHRMHDWLEAFYEGMKAEGLSVKQTHYMSPKQWGYLRDIAGMAGCLTSELEDFLSLNQQIYEDSRGRVPKFPGGDDIYRENMYSVNRNMKQWAVSPCAQKDL